MSARSGAAPHHSGRAAAQRLAFRSTVPGPVNARARGAWKSPVSVRVAPAATWIVVPGASARSCARRVLRVTA